MLVSHRVPAPLSPKDHFAMFFKNCLFITKNVSYYFTAIGIGQRVGCRHVAPLGEEVFSNIKGFLQFCRMTQFFYKSRAYRFSIRED